MRAGLTSIFKSAKWRTLLADEPGGEYDKSVDLMVVDASPHGGEREAWLTSLEQPGHRLPVLLYGEWSGNGHHAAIPADATVREIIHTAKKVACGRDAKSPSTNRTNPPSALCLTRREREVYDLLARGRRNRHIAAKLGISVKTVETHKEHLKQKLGLESTADLMEHAIGRGFNARKD